MTIKPLLLALITASLSFAQFQLHDRDHRSLQLTEAGNPVFTYNYGHMTPPAGAPADRARCCYLHPVHAPNGAVITDDFPKDHYHHRGISWMWPVVKVDGRAYDLWTIKGILARHERWLRKEAGPDSATLAFVNGWYIGDRKVVEEQVTITAHKGTSTARHLDFEIQLRPIARKVEIGGWPDAKGYGGFNIRFAPRTNTRIATPAGADVPDSDNVPNPWTELTADYAGGQPAAVRITSDPSNPAQPPTWCLRHYGFLGANYPGITPIALTGNLTLKYRVTLSVPQKRVLVYTKNGKGYVHDNIADSVAAIRKMGAENNFHVDASEDPAVFTDANLKQYSAVVFSNTNNEAFDTQQQRDAFQRYIKSGGGFVGIHSASGSERQWPWFWTVTGGKFLYHPKLQPFTIKVVDPTHPATESLPAEFEWEDECYHLEFMNPNLRPLLLTDRNRLDDPKRAQYPYAMVGSALPLAWTLNTEGGRQFYTSLGHKKEHYQNPLLIRHILGGIRWALDSPRKDLVKP